MDEIASLGYWIRRRRKALDLTRDELARRVGCAAVTLVKIEADERRPSEQMAERLADALLLTLEEQADFLEIVRGERWAGALTVSTRPLAGAPSPPGQPAWHARSHNLPRQRNLLLGRERELAELCALLKRDDMGLVTLTGPGGTGKTRLGLQVAAALLGNFPDGVWFVDLAPLKNHTLVPATITATLGVKESGGQALAERLTTYLRDKQVLLLLDNFEQVVAAAPFVAELLNTAPRVKALVTSRAALHLSGEQQFPVPPLALPDSWRLPALDLLAQTEAVALFLQQARMVKPDFALTNENAQAVVAICQRLDGLPLAIELAASWSKFFAPQALLARMQPEGSRRLHLLIGGAQDLPSRQRTMRSTIAWSYDRLDLREQRLFARLGIFVGGCALEAVEAVCGDHRRGDSGNDDRGATPIRILEGLQALVDMSLLQVAGGAVGEPRFTMLETIREYALEQLLSSGEAHAVRQQHAAFFLKLAEEAESQLYAGEQAVWLDRLEIEHDNLRAALSAALEAGEAEVALRLSATLAYFWDIHGRLSEGRRWLEAALAAPGGSPASIRARALLAAGHIAAEGSGDRAQAVALLEESLAIFRGLDDRSRYADALDRLGQIAWAQGDHVRAEARSEESLALAREVGDQQRIAWALRSLAFSALHEGNITRAAPLLAESLTLAREVGDTYGVAMALEWLGIVAREQGDSALAMARTAESLALYRELGNTSGIAWALYRLEVGARDQSDEACAMACLAESLTRFAEIDETPAIAVCLDVCAGVAVKRGQPERAARLYGAAEVRRDALQVLQSPADRANYARDVAAIRTQLDTATWDAAWNEGQAMPLEQAIAYALDETEPE